MKEIGYSSRDWAFDNPVLPLRNVGIETDTRRMKIGDGVTPWNDLGYVADVDPNNHLKISELPEDWESPATSLKVPTLTNFKVENDATVIEGVVDVNINVNLYEDQSTIESVTADASGNYSFNLERALPVGGYWVQPIDSEGNVPCGVVNLWVNHDGTLGGSEQTYGEEPIDVWPPENGGEDIGSL